MKGRFRLWSMLLLLLPAGLAAQGPVEPFLREMQRFEGNVISTYRAYQWLFYEEKRSHNELLAFEDLLGVYVNRLREAYETLGLIGRSGIEEARDIAARAYVYRALTFLEKAPIDIRYFERACYDYYEALQLYENTQAVPVIFKPLPQAIRIGPHTYHRLIDLLEAKGRDLFAFGQVHLLLRNFKVTSDFNESSLSLVRYMVSGSDTVGYTYHLAEDRLKEGFRQAFRSDQPVEVYLALPAGIYAVRSQKSTPSDYVDLAKIYVRPNQFISYIVEPIADWVIFYETPEYLVQASLAGSEPVAIPSLDSEEEIVLPALVDKSPAAAGTPDSSLAETPEQRLQRIESAVADYLQKMPLEKVEKLPITRTRKEFVRKVAQMINNQKMGDYLNSWNRWTFAWNLAKQTTRFLQPDGDVTTPMVELIHGVLLQIYKGS